MLRQVTRRCPDCKETITAYIPFEPKDEFDRGPTPDYIICREMRGWPAGQRFAKDTRLAGCGGKIY